MNMSYCRFRNTRMDLDACLDSIRMGERLDGPEADAGRMMFRGFLDFCQEYGIIDGYDEEAVGGLFDDLRERR